MANPGEAMLLSNSPNSAGLAIARAKLTTDAPIMAYLDQSISALSLGFDTAKTISLDTRSPVIINCVATVDIAAARTAIRVAPLAHTGRYWVIAICTTASAAFPLRPGISMGATRYPQMAAILQKNMENRSIAMAVLRTTTRLFACMVPMTI